MITAVTGGRPGMISAATGAMALVMVGLVRDHGLQYLLAATVRVPAPMCACPAQGQGLRTDLMSANAD